MTLTDLKLLKQGEKESFFEFVVRWTAKTAHLVDHPFEKDQVRLVVKNLRSMYQQYLTFQSIPIVVLRGVGMLVKEEPSSIKATNTAQATKIKVRRLMTLLIREKKYIQ